MVTVRPATQGDLLDMEALISQSVEMGDVLPRTLEELTDLLPSFFVAEAEDGRIVGTAALEVYNRKLAEVRSLCTSPETRGEGIGRALVAACLDRARDKGILEVMAITDKDAFFRACGFDYSLPNQRRALFFPTGE